MQDAPGLLSVMVWVRPAVAISQRLGRLLQSVHLVV